MKRMSMVAGLVAVISLTVSVIWPAQVMAATSPTLTYLGTFSDKLPAPGTIEMDGDGNFYVADADWGVVKFNRAGKLVARFDVDGVSSKGILVSPAGDKIYVSAGDRVLILDAEGAVVESFGAGAGEFGEAGEIDQDGEGFIWVIDTVRYVARQYDANGIFQGESRQIDVASGSFNAIAAMAIDAARNELYIADLQKSAKLTTPNIRVYDLGSGNIGAELRQSSGTFLGGFGGIEFDNQARAYFLDSISGKMVVWGLQPPGTAMTTPTTLLTANVTSLQVPEGVDTKYKQYALSFTKDAVFDAANSRLILIAGSVVAILGVDNYTIPVANAAPGIPQPVDPVASGEVTTSLPPLEFTVPVDPDGDSLTYEVELACAGGDPVLYAAIATNSFQVPAALPENQSCIWRVQAFDGTLYSGWSDPAGFVVNAVAEAPSTPALDLPQAGAVSDVAAQFVWSASTDADPGATVSYRFEFGTDGGFADPLSSVETANLSLPLDSLSAFAQIEPQVGYFWRVIAVDNTGLESMPSEVRELTVLTTAVAIDANMPGAKVYFGGNHGYHGRLVGETPYVASHVPAGSYSVVVAYPGLESAVGIVDVVEGEKIVSSFVLKPAFVSQDFGSGNLVSGGLDPVTGQAAPFLVDFNNDGLLDILVGDSAGDLTLFPGTEMDPDATTMKVGPKQVLDVDLPPGAAPFVVDWDNDDRKDLVIGTGSGSILLLVNNGSDREPVFGAESYLSIGVYPINAGADAVPAVYDYDGDGDKDLITGNARGVVSLYANEGTDAAPALQVATTLATFDSPAAPFAADLDGNGALELLVAAGTDVYRVVAGDPATLELVYAAAGNGNAKGKSALRGPLRLFAVDTDAKKGKDLVLGTANGKIELARANAQSVSPAFIAAMNVKLDEVATLLADSAPELLSNVEVIRGDLQSSDFVSAWTRAQTLLVAVSPTSEAAGTVTEVEYLLSLLQ